MEFILPVMRDFRRKLISHLHLPMPIVQPAVDSGSSAALTFNLLAQPGAAVRPPPAGSWHRNAKDFRGFFQLEADKIAKLHQFRLLLISRSELVERFANS